MPHPPSSTGRSLETLGWGPPIIASWPPWRLKYWDEGSTARNTGLPRGGTGRWRTGASPSGSRGARSRARRGWPEAPSPRPRRDDLVGLLPLAHDVLALLALLAHHRHARGALQREARDEPELLLVDLAARRRSAPRRRTRGTARAAASRGRGSPSAGRPAWRRGRSRTDRPAGHRLRLDARGRRLLLLGRVGLRVDDVERIFPCEARTYWRSISRTRSA
jgi:hypothetical protein